MSYIEKHGKWALDRTEWGNDSQLLIANIFFNVNKKLLVRFSKWQCISISSNWRYMH